MQVPYLVGSDQDGDVVLKCENVEEGQLYPEEVSGQILTHLLAHAQHSMQASISKAVISVHSCKLFLLAHLSLCSSQFLHPVIQAIRCRKSHWFSSVSEQPV